MENPGLNPERTPEVQPRPALGCFWKVLITAGISLLLIVIVVVWQVMSVKSWLENGVESAPAVLPAPPLGPEEQRELEDLHRGYAERYEQKKDLDIMLTVTQFNRMVAENIAKQKAKGGKPELEALQVSFEGLQTVFRGTAPVPDRPGFYYNFEFRGAFSIEHAKATWMLDNVRLRGQDAPYSARTILQEALRKGFEQQEARYAQGGDSIFRRVKLLRREGDRIHAILNGQYLEAPDR